MLIPSAILYADDAPEIRKAEDKKTISAIELYQQFISGADGDRCPMLSSALGASAVAAYPCRRWCKSHSP